MSVMEKLQNMGGIILGIALLFLVLSVGMIFVYGTTWLASYVQPIVDTLNQYSLGIAICVIFPLSYFRKMRSICMDWHFNLSHHHGFESLARFSSFCPHILGKHWCIYWSSSWWHNNHP